MNSKTIRWIIILAIFTCIGIIVVQMYWVKSAYQLQENAFELNVKQALRNAAYDIFEEKGIKTPNYNPVEQVGKDYFIVQTDVSVEKDVLEHYLVTNITDEKIFTDFVYGQFDCSGNALQYQSYYHFPGGRLNPVETLDKLPKRNKVNYSFAVYFPHCEQFLNNQLSTWTISSFLLMVVIGVLGYLIFVIFKQKRLSEIQRDFVNNMTHEFKTPLSTIRLAADVLKTPKIVEQPQRLLNYATIISNESTQLTAQVERVLQMAHTEKGTLELKSEQFDWQTLIKEETDSFEDIINTKNGKVILEMPEKPIKYRGDILHLKNMIANLIDNGLKYCDDAPQIKITLKENDQNEILISIKDNGIGIDQSNHKMLFTKFFRVSTGNIHNVKGFGLGLNYVRLIARAHGGDVKCESELKKGSTFTLSFPKQIN